MEEKAKDLQENAPKTEDLSEAGKGKRILIVDDEEGSIELVKGVLGKVGFEVISALTGEEGLRRSAEEKPHVVIADVIMPQMDGYVFFKGLKENEATKNIPVYIFTARKNMEDAFLASGVDGFMAKPMETKKFITDILRLSQGVKKAETKEGGEKKEGEEKKDGEKKEKPPEEEKKS